MRHRGAFHVYLLLSGASSLLFALIFTVNMVYQVTVVGLNPLQLILVGTVLEITVFLCEVPTGVVADVFSRRLSVIIGFFLIGVGFVLEGAIPTFAAVLAAQVLWGLGVTFTSGATEAWITDEIGEDAAGRAFLRAGQIGHAAWMLGLILSVGLASIRVNLPIVIGGLLFIGLAGLLVLTMPEHGFRPVPRGEGSSWAAMRQTLLAGLQLTRQRRVIPLILGVTLFFGLASEAYDRLWQVFLLDRFAFPELGRLEPVVWFGIIGAVGSILSIGATEFARRRGLDTAGTRVATRALLLLTAVQAAAVVGFALAGSFVLALVALWTVSVTRAVTDPVMAAWLNRNLEPSVRATVFSLNGQVNAIGQIAGGPPLGALGTAVSIRAALVASGLILTPTLLLFARAGRRPDAATRTVEPVDSVAGTG